jgi:hypothetical protein
MNDAEIWDAYNCLLLSHDVERIRKLIARYELLRMTIDVPGDIVECGVFKGVGFLYWLKLKKILIPGAAKRVVGFDMFHSFGTVTGPKEEKAVAAFVKETEFEGVSPESIMACAEAAGFGDDSAELVAGDIGVTAEDYCQDKPGFRISLLNMDLDLDQPTFSALQAFWPRVVKGGVVIFDEYALGRWTESDGVDRFFESKGQRLRTLAISRTPTAYVIKE